MRNIIFSIWFFISIVLSTVSLSSQTLLVLNRSGFNLMEMHILKDGQPGENLIPYDVILDQSYIELPLEPQEGMVFRFIDESGDVYVKTYKSLPGPPKMVVTLNDLQVLSHFSNSLRFRFYNAMGAPITSIYLSPADSDEWGEDLLNGAILRLNKTIELEIPYRGSSIFDIRFYCYENNQYREYILKSQELRDLGIFELRSL